MKGFAENEKELAIHVDCQLLFACDSLLHTGNPGGLPYGGNWYILQTDGTLFIALNGNYGLVSEDTLS